MNFEIEVSNWYVALTISPGYGRDHPAHDGRELVLEGKSRVGEVYYAQEDRRFDGATCRIYLRPVDTGTEPLQEIARWSQESTGLWVALDLNLPRPLWEDLWLRTHHALPKIRVHVSMEAVKGLPHGADGLAGLSFIGIST